MKSKWLSGPYVIWMVLFTLIPLGIVFYFAFTDGAGQFTLANIQRLGAYLPILLRSAWMSIFSSILCLLIGYPVAYCMSKASPTRQKIYYMLIMLPMCLSFLLRTMAWVSLLEDTGILNNFLRSLGLSPLPLIRNTGAVILGMVYNYLPYMILPLYTAMVKIDNSIIEAAQDLGADIFRVLGRVLIPLAMPGIATGITMVFVPSVSTFIISRMLGGGDTMLVGDLIELQFLGNSYNYNLGSAMSLVLMVIVLLCMSLTNTSGNKDGVEGVM